MAKSKGFFGLRSGSTKNFTFSELNGQQITKERVYKVKNPRTMQQMRQRMVMATVSAAYSYLKEICDHSFEGFGVGSPCMGEFMRLNLDALKAKAQNDAAMVAFNAYQDKNINPVPFIVSQGSIVGPAFDVSDNEVSIGFNATSDEIATAESIYNKLGIQPGDLITFLSVCGTEDNTEGYKFAPLPLSIVRLRANKTGAVNSVQDAFSIESNNVNNVEARFAQDTKYYQISAMAENLVMGAVILSRKTSDKWLRSTAQMEIMEEINISTSVARQLATYPVERDLILNGSGLDNDSSTSKLPKPSLSLSASSMSISKANGTTIAPTLSGAPAGAAVTYSIANSNVATINPSTGVATAKANGTTLVTISVGATATTRAATISYTLIVTGQTSDAGGGDTGDGE